MAGHNEQARLVVVGSSAGGIEALSKLVSTLPEGFSAPVLIAQHLDPAWRSHLEEILSRHSRLPVKTVTDHQILEPGTIYVVPSDRHVNVADDEIDLAVDGQGRPKPSVDLLMSSAAEVFGEHLIAVVLSGTGSDGEEGARVVRKAGGTVVIQDPETAAFGGMTGSLAPNTVDIVADLERIGPILGELISGTTAADEAVEEDEKRSLGSFLEGLKERYRVDFTSYKTPTIRRRLKRRMVATGSTTIEDYDGYLNENPEELQQLVNTLLIKVTEFFRDPDTFAYLKEEVLPRLLAEAREEGRQLRIWSAGCATGEEAYTLAILISELLGPRAALAEARIFATDVDDAAVVAVGPDNSLLFSNAVFRETFGDGEPGEPDATLRLGRMVPLDENAQQIPREDTPRARAARGESFDTRIASELDGSLRRFEVRGRPIGDDDAVGVLFLWDLEPSPEGSAGGEVR